MDPPERFYAPSVSPLPAHSELAGETSNPVPDPSLLHILASRSNVAQMISPHSRVPRLVPFTINSRAGQHSARLFTKRRTPINLRREVALPYNMGLEPKEPWPYQQAIFSLLGSRIYARPTNSNPYHSLGILLLPTQLGVPLPDKLREVAPYRQLLIKWYTPVHTEERPSELVDELSEDVEPPLWQYGIYRPPNLGKHSPEERLRVRDREVRLVQKLQERRKRKNAKAGIEMNPDPPAWLVVWMEMMKHGCILGGKDKPEDWEVRSIARWKGTEKENEVRAVKQVKWADEV
ncbi:unnamed protein product [Rhizoctonia solani]|uniref:Uncharacterized protein n=1 Tax=Rhizoctonia solani TaxID=456999 RepID=A0A8H2WMG1_9AGAM|nr:unnamed protein product [Rhizoctonia solani]